MRYGSVCSGIEAATVAWHPLGWEAQWFSEIEKFPSTVLAHHYPSVPNLGDMTKIHETEAFKDRPINLLVGGTPCQSFSVAGLRKGMADPRGNLALVFLKLVDLSRPRWVVWENVPGVLSSSEGRDFGSFVGGLGELGYGWAYRVLDAQYFGVPQRRRRVFVVGYLGDWRPAAAVLFERHSLSGDNPPHRKAGKGSATCFTTSPDGSGREDTAAPTLDTRAKDGPRRNQGGTIIQVPTNELCPTLKARDYKDINSDDTAHGGKHVMVYENHPADSRITECKDEAGPTVTSRYGTGGGNVPIVTEHIRDEQPIVLEDQGGSVMNVSTDGLVGTLRREAHGHEPILLTMRDGCEGGGKGPLLQVNRSGTLATGNGQVLFNPRGVEGEAIPINTQIATRSNKMGEGTGLGIGDKGDPGFTLQAAHNHAVFSAMQVRRLTPVECARLQGFPDTYLDIEFRGKPASDGPKYKALGNSMAVPVMAWIGQRIKQLEGVINK